MNNTADYRIYVGGNLLDPGYNLKLLSFEESLTETGKFEFEIYYSPELPLSVEQFRIKTPVKLQLGYNGDLHDMFEGFIYDQIPTFPENDSPYLKIVCYDVSYKLKDSKKRKLFAEDTPRGVIKKILDDYKGIEYIEDIPMLGNIFYLPPDHALYQEEKTDWEMLIDIAKLGEYWAFVYNGIIYVAGVNYVLANLQAEEFVMVYRPDEDFLGRMLNKKVIPLKNFAPVLTCEKLTDAIEITIYKPVGGEPEDHVFLSDANTGQFKLSSVPRGNEIRDLMFAYNNVAVADATNVRIESITGEEAQNLGQAKIVGTERIKAKRRDTISGPGEISGEPTLRIGQRHHFLLRSMGEFGEFYSGYYLITGTKHEITEDGYKTSFHVAHSEVVLLEE